jgi:hypothetical protein
MVQNSKHYVILEEWMVAFNKQLEKYCLDGCILAFARATVTGFGGVSTVSTKLSSLTQQRLATIDHPQGVAK